MQHLCVRQDFCQELQTLMTRQVGRPGGDDGREGREPTGDVEPIVTDQTCVLDDYIRGEECKDVSQQFWDTEDSVRCWRRSVSVDRWC